MSNEPVPVLISIDMQRGFDLGDDWPPRWNSRCDENGIKLLAHWRANNWPVFHVRHNSIDSNSNLRPGCPGNDFRPGFGPTGTEPVISKSVNSAFIGTDLDIQLRRLNVSQLVFFGITTDQCVSTSVRMACNLGWRCVLVEDACDCFQLPGLDAKAIPAADVHAVHVATLAFEFCAATTTEQCIASSSHLSSE